MISGETVDKLDERLKSTKEWHQVLMLCEGQDFGDAPETLNKNFALSFLLQTASLTSYSDNFLHVFVKAIQMIGIMKLPQPQAFVPFLNAFKPNENHKLADLIVLFEFTKAVGSSWEWLG